MSRILRGALLPTSESEGDAGVALRSCSVLPWSMVEAVLQVSDYEDRGRRD